MRVLQATARFIFRLTLFVSSLACVIACVFWARSYLMVDHAERWGDSMHLRLSSYDGHLQIAFTPGPPGVGYFAFPDGRVVWSIWDGGRQLPYSEQAFERTRQWRFDSYPADEVTDYEFVHFARSPMLAPPAFHFAGLRWHDPASYTSLTMNEMQWASTTEWYAHTLVLVPYWQLVALTGVLPALALIASLRRGRNSRQQ